MLIENTLFGIRDKVEIALETLRTYEPPEGYYVAYSGGKDSTVILDLVRRSGVKYDAHYNITTVDPPELFYFIQKQPDVFMESPEMSMWQLIVKNHMPPTRIARYCCATLKERGGNNRRVVTGVRAAESARRAKRRQIETCYQDSTKTFLHLIFHWETEDVWEYIKSRGLDYCNLYNEGLKRLGCICCPLGTAKGQLREAERWPKYKEQYVRTFEKMLEQMPNPTTDWKTGEDVWLWWTRQQCKQNCDANQRTFIFDN